MPTERKTLADRRPLDIGKAHYELLSELKADLARQGIKSTSSFPSQARTIDGVGQLKS